MTLPAEPLTLAAAALGVLVVAWNLAEGARLASAASLTRSIRLLAGLVAFACLPAWLSKVLAEVPAGARILQPLRWFWPLVTLAFAAQAGVAVLRGRGSRWITIACLGFNLMAAWVAITAGLATTDWVIAPWVLMPGAAWGTFVARYLGSDVYALAPVALFPVVAPMLPARTRTSRVVRVVLAATALGLVTGWGVLLPRTWQAATRAATAPIEGARERARSEFALGLRLFGPLDGPPSSTIARADVALADSLGVTLVHVTLGSDALVGSALDSISRAIEARRDSVALVVTLGAQTDSASVIRVMNRLRPDVIVPVATGSPPRLEDEEREALRIARVARRVDRNVTVAMATTARDARDSTLVDHANSGLTAIDAVALIGRPGPDADRAYRRALATIDRWAGLHRSPATVWLLGVPATPTLDGNASQQRLVRQALQWGSAHPYVRGVSIGDATDGWRTAGMRRPGGPARPVLGELVAALRALRDAPAPAIDSTLDGVRPLPDTLPTTPPR